MPDLTGPIAIQLILLAVMLFGLTSLVIPIIPGLTIIWVAALVYAFVTGLNWGTGILFALITILMVVGNFIDHILMGAGAKKTGSSWLAVAAATVAGLVGSILWPPFGGILLSLVGIFVVEIIRMRNLEKAWVSTRGMAIGCGAAFFARFGVGVVMILLWGVWVYLVSR